MSEQGAGMINSWSKIRLILKSRLGKNIFKNWIESIELVKIEKKSAFFNVPNSFIANWIERNYTDIIIETFKNEEIFINNNNLINNSRKIRELIGYVAQDIALDKILTGRELLDFQSDLYHINKNKKFERINKLIDQLEMNDWIDRKCGTYSGGMKRRIDLAAGLLHLPQVLILDEPTVGLDIESRNIIWQLLKDLRNNGMTIILSSHYLDEIDKLADRLVIIDDGRVIAKGTPAELKNKLGGDRVTLKVREFSNQEEANNISKILSSIDGISQIIINEAQGFSINFVADKQKDLLTKLKVELAFSKFEIFSHTQSQPSFDDVYLQATGKTLLDAEISMAGKRDLKKESKQSMR